MCDSSNCSAFGLKTLYSDDIDKCILSTTSTDSTSAVGTTLSESETSTTYTTPPTGEDGGQVTLCVSACPGGFYEDQCKNCTMDTCLECTYGRNSTGDCCPNGTRSKDNGNITICVVIPSTREQAVDDKKYIIIGCVVGGVVVLGLLVVVVCLCCRRQGNGQQGQTRPISRLLEVRKTTIFHVAISIRCKSYFIECFVACSSGKERITITLTSSFQVQTS